MATRTSAAALFLATILLLAAASALAQAPAPAPGPSSSPCPLGLDRVLSGMQTPIKRAEIAGQLSGLSPSDITLCICNVANGSTSDARNILTKLLEGLVITINVNINALNCTAGLGA